MIERVVAALGEYIQAGSPAIMLTLAGLAAVLWYALGIRAVLLNRGSESSVRVLIRRHEEGRGGTRGVLNEAIRRGLAVRAAGRRPLRAHLDDAFADLRIDLKRHRALINAVVLSAPLLGLLGTVSGMIETFHSLGDMSLFAQSGGIAGGIATALFTTQLGLAVAIPGYFAKSVLDRRQARLEMDLAQIEDILTAAAPEVRT
ncbi:MAG: MotA/TolQ/ExbB proton channel family protein [Xanthomonadales bacterium]|nr:MotA/TolQ/ExbB proton channel family protein [Xanthomonadales bacterium]